MPSSGKFVIQKHVESGEVHWDLMLQVGDILRTYRLMLPPGELLSRGCTATKIFDHPLKFLTYEGKVNSGAGSVEIVDRGTYELVESDQRQLRIHFEGVVLLGMFRLVHVVGESWEFARACGV